jgi:cation transporter-like permease
MSLGNTSVASVISVTANPPSEIAPEETTPLIPDSNMDEAHLGHFVDDERPLDVMVSLASNQGVTNRSIRPGMIMTPPRVRSSPGNRGDEMKRSISMPVIVDGFDYDKFDAGVQYTYSAEQDSDLPGDELWSPSSAMNISPWHDRKMAPLAVSPQQKNVPFFRNDQEEGSARETTLDSRYHVKYGSTSQDRTGMLSRVAHQEDSEACMETAPLVGMNGTINSRTKARGRPRARPFLEAAESVLRAIRSNDPEDDEEESHDSEKYQRSKLVARAFPERQIALMVTLLVEIPVLLMVSGGSDRLCSVIGRKKYQLMMGFLPLSCAISGNCGLQASTLTIRAITYDHVTLDNYASWLRAEVGAALVLGLNMGFVLGTCAFFMSGLDIVFALAIFMAHLVSAVASGLTGTLAPLVFTFIFRRDSGKWCGPLETAIQDIVGSFAMVVMSYQLLVLFGPRELDPSDVCGPGSV